MNTPKCILVCVLIQISNGAEKDMEPFVIGGAYVNIMKYPHSAFLFGHCHNGLAVWICGSAILNQKLLITAAHCVFGCKFSPTSGDYMDVFVGHANLTKARAKRQVAQAVYHKQYDEVLVSNDIALVKLDKNLPLGQNVKRVLITAQFSPNFYEGYVAGWGSISKKGEGTIILKHIYQKLRSIKTCALVGQLEMGMFCAGSTEKKGQEHPAQGDSGSALITKDFHQIGVVSFRIIKLPALLVYTNVSYYYSWIQQNAKTLFCNRKY